MAPRARRARRCGGWAAVLLSVTLAVTACAELTGSGSDLGRAIPSAIAKYVAPDPPPPGAGGRVPGAPIPAGALRYRRLLMQAWEYHFGLANAPPWHDRRSARTACATSLGS